MRRTAPRARSTGVRALLCLVLVGIVVSATATSATAAKQPPTPIEALDSFAFKASLSLVGAGGSAVNGFTLDTNGVYVAPSSQKCTVEAGLGSLQIQRSAVVIGKLVWVDTGNGVKTAKASDYDFADQCPSDAGFWKQLDFDVPSTIKGKPETKNGVKTEHVDLTGTAGQLASLGLVDQLPADVTFQTFEAWRATKGGWIVALDIIFTAASSASCSSLLGDSIPVPVAAPCTLHIAYDITRANDKSLKVTPPKTSGKSK